MATNTMVFEPSSPNAALMRSTVCKDGASRGMRSTDCWRTTVSSCGNSSARTTAAPSHTPMTSALCRRVNRARVANRSLYSRVSAGSVDPLARRPGRLAWLGAAVGHLASTGSDTAGIGTLPHVVQVVTATGGGLAQERHESTPYGIAAGQSAANTCTACRAPPTATVASAARSLLGAGMTTAAATSLRTRSLSVLIVNRCPPRSPMVARAPIGGGCYQSVATYCGLPRWTCADAVEEMGRAYRC